MTSKIVNTPFLLLVFLTHFYLSPAGAQENSWQSLFNGNDLSGWKELNGAHLWEVKDGMIVGRTVPGQPNGFLCTEQEFDDFVLELEVSVDTLMNNSGIQFRSQSYPEFKYGRVHGYQMEVDPKPQQWSGAIYEEGGDRGWIYPPAKMSQMAKPDERPYLHPIMAPDGNGVLTEYRPAHHPHQTGIYWGLKRVNERDYFMQWNSDYWRGVSATVLEKKGEKVKWQTVYDMLDENGSTIMVETQNWTMQQFDDRYILDLE